MLNYLNRNFVNLPKFYILKLYDVFELVTCNIGSYIILNNFLIKYHLINVNKQNRTFT